MTHSGNRHALVPLMTTCGQPAASGAPRRADCESGSRQTALRESTGSRIRQRTVNALAPAAPGRDSSEPARHRTRGPAARSFAVTRKRPGRRWPDVAASAGEYVPCSRQLGTFLRGSPAAPALHGRSATLSMRGPSMSNLYLQVRRQRSPAVGSRPRCQAQARDGVIVVPAARSLRPSRSTS
jgi:hypothetical protein